MVRYLQLATATHWRGPFWNQRETVEKTEERSQWIKLEKEWIKKVGKIRGKIQFNKKENWE